MTALPAPLVEMASTMYLRAAEIIREDLPVSIEAEFVRILTDAWPAALASLATPDLREAVEGAVEAAFAAAYDERSTATHVLAVVTPLVEALRVGVERLQDELEGVCSLEKGANDEIDDLRAQVAALEADRERLREEIALAAKMPTLDIPDRLRVLLCGWAERPQ